MVLPLLYWASYGENLEGAAGHAVLVASCTIGGKGGDLGFFLLLRFGFSRFGFASRPATASARLMSSLGSLRGRGCTGDGLRFSAGRSSASEAGVDSVTRDPETSLGAAGVGVACTEGVRDEAAGAGVFIADSILRLCSSRLRSSARNRCRATSPALLPEKASAMPRSSTVTGLPSHHLSRGNKDTTKDR